MLMTKLLVRGYYTLSQPCDCSLYVKFQRGVMDDSQLAFINQPEVETVNVCGSMTGDHGVKKEDQ